MSAGRAAQKVWDALDAHARSLPASRVDIKWGNDRCHLLADKMFAVFRLDEAGRPRGLSLKVEASRFLELTGLPGVHPAPYLARAHWVWFEAHDALPLSELRALLAHSHALIAAKLTRKLRAELGLTP